jgi:hypothetical protein
MPFKAIWKTLFQLPDYKVKFFLKLAGENRCHLITRNKAKHFSTVDVYITSTTKCLIFTPWIALLSIALACIAIELYILFQNSIKNVWGKKLFSHKFNFKMISAHSAKYIIFQIGKLNCSKR